MFFYKYAGIFFFMFSIDILFQHFQVFEMENDAS